jgi:hypothetical protein
VPNAFAYLILFIWPLVVVQLFIKKDISYAIFISFLLGYLLLPVNTGIDLPGLPALNKFSITTLSVLFGCLFIKRSAISFVGSNMVVKVMLILFLLMPFFTALSNSEPTSFSPGLSFKDGLSSMFKNFMFIVPFILGRQFFNNKSEQLFIFKCLVISVLFYSIPILYEIRMSPQLHTMIYGFFPHSFVQQARGGGFRAVVFLGHGLWVAFFVAIGLSSMFLLWKAKVRVTSYNPLLVLIYLMVVLVLSKSLASLIYALLMGVLMIFCSAKLQSKVAMMIAVFVITYPMLSIQGWFPHSNVLEVAQTVSVERADSLGFRFKNEHELVQHANQKPLLGWGGWGRNRVHDEYTGADLSTTDGKWIQTFGTYGWLGYLTEFGLIFYTLLFAYRSLHLLVSNEEKIILSGHMLIVAIIFLDQIPNASTTPVYLLIIGSLLGRAEQIQRNKNNR